MTFRCGPGTHALPAALRAPHDPVGRRSARRCPRCRRRAWPARARRPPGWPLLRRDGAGPACPPADPRLLAGLQRPCDHLRRPGGGRRRCPGRAGATCGATGPPTVPTGVQEVPSTPVVQEVRSTPVVQEERSTPVVQEERSTPVVQEERSTPVVQEERSTPGRQEERSTPGRQEVRAPRGDRRYEAPRGDRHLSRTACCATHVARPGRRRPGRPLRPMRQLAGPQGLAAAATAPGAPSDGPAGGLKTAPR